MLPTNNQSVISRRGFLATAASGVAATLPFPLLATAQDKQPAKPNAKVEDAVERGLHWLKGVQAKNGSWEATGGNYRIAMTALAGMAFLMEGSTLKDGRYSNQIRDAANWLMAPTQQQPNGLIADRGAGSDFGNYIHGHGYATLFLACVYGEGDDRDDQRKIERAVAKAVEFSVKSQSLRKHSLPEGKQVEIGGWGYVSASERDFDEGSTTITQLQALRAARNAAIPVPKQAIDRAVAYLEACTTPKGGIIYSYTLAGGKAISGQERPPLTAAAVCCGFSAGEYKSETPKKWIKFCKDNIPIAKGRMPHDEYQNYYYSQFVYALGENKYGEMFPKDPKDSWLTWSKFRDLMYPYLLEQQTKEGSWTGGYISPVFATSVNLAILQLEKGLLPIYDR